MNIFWAARYINTHESFFNHVLQRDKHGNVCADDNDILERAPQLVGDLFDHEYDNEAFTVLNFLGQESPGYFREALEYIAVYSEDFVFVGVNMGKFYVFSVDDCDAVADYEEIEFTRMSLAELSAFGKKFYKGKM